MSRQENIYTCDTCKSSYTPINLPYILVNCPHLMCKRCIISSQICAMCGTDVGLNDHCLNDFIAVGIDQLQQKLSSIAQSQIKTESASQIMDKLCLHQNKQIHIQQCLLHLKPADLVCVQDGAVICSSCALFGKHKGHEVINREGILTQFTSYVEDCLKHYDNLKEVNAKFSSNIYRALYLNIIQSKKQKDKKKIQQKFQQLIAMVKVAEKKQLLRLTEHYKEKQKLFELKQNKIQKIQVQIKKWCLQIQKIGALMQDTSSLQKVASCIPYIDTRNPIGDQIVNTGYALIAKLQQTQKQMQRQLFYENNENILVFDDQKIKTIGQFCAIKKQQNGKHRKIQSILSSQEKITQSPAQKIIIEKNYSSSMKKDRIKTQNPIFQQKPAKIKPFYKKNQKDIQSNFIDDNLLISVEPPQIQKNQSTNLPVFPKVHMVAEELDIQTMPFLSISDIRPITNISSGQSSDQSRSLTKQRQLKQICNAGMIGLAQNDKLKKTKKTQIPQKFKGIVDDLKNDRAQTIDLTGAQLGDGTIISLCPFIKKSKKLKTLKLIKNKISDDCLEQLLQAINQSRICSLNLSQNLLSDKSCFIFHASLNSSHLKSITLSLNKINRRNVKNKTDQLAKKNIAILL